MTAPLVPFSYIVICEDCGFSVDLRKTPGLLKGWGHRYEQLDRAVIPVGDVCDICMAKARAEG